MIGGTTHDLLAFWQVFFGAILIAFFVLGIAAGIGGWRDVRTMLERLRDERHER